MRSWRTVAHRGSVLSIGATMRLQDQDLTGQRFGKLLVLRSSHTSQAGKDRHWECRCDCGNTSTPTANNLYYGLSKSCGCAGVKTTHGLSKTPEYKVWASMKARCLREPRYAGRGIAVCERWQEFEGFFEDMGPRPSSGSTIERLDNNGNYEPGNCCWATRLQQNNNKSNNLILELNGTKKTAKEWSRCLGLPYQGLIQRLRNGWSHEEALLKPFRACRKRKQQTAK